MKYLLSGIILLLSSLASGQDTLREYISHPDPYRSGEFHAAAGVSMTAVPRVIVEEEVRSIPVLDFHCRYGLPAGFSIAGRVSTNVITNFAMVTPGWSFEFDRLSLGVGYGLAYWYGFATFDGFDVTARSWLHFPNASLGIDFEDWMLTIRGDLQVVASRTTETDGTEVSTDQNRVTGYGVGLSIEQPFFGRTHSLISFKLNYSKAMYQAWLAFSTFNDYLVYPEFSFALLF